MNIKTYCRVSALLFTIVAIAHLTRLISGWPIQVNGAVIPLNVSWVGFVIAGGLATWGFRESRAVRR
jgi:ABC-type methionine transport system permease subunit